jgi:C-terminal processing protease CtpA/Prc
MKKIIFLFLLSVLSMASVNAQLKSSSSDSVAFFSGQKLSAQKTEDLFILGKVWGVLKYFHPQVAAGKFDWDRELVTFLPGYLKIHSIKERSDSLTALIARLGEIPAKKAGNYDSIKDAKLRPDFSWINTKNFSPALVKNLNYILDNRAQGDQYYIKFHREEGLNIPEFVHEKMYASPLCPSAGYRLIALFRFWNVIEYWYPYKYNLDKPWDAVLKEHVVTITQAGTAPAYTLDIEKLVSFIKDGHSFIQSKTAMELKGYYYWPFTVADAENKFIVASITNDTAAAGIEKGDIIEKINGKKIEEVFAEKIQYIPASTPASGRLEFARDLKRTTDSITTIEVRRGSITKTVSLKNVYSKKYYDRWKPVLSYQKDSSICIFPGNVLYLNVGNIKSKDSTRIKELIKSSNGLIIDVRQNMEENGEAFNPFYIISTSLKQGPSPNTFTTQQPEFAGTFKFMDPAFLPKDPVVYHYKKRIAILTDAAVISVGETMAMDFSMAYDATLIGMPTSGTNGMNSTLIMPGNMLVGFSGTGNYWLSGKEIQRIGIQPKIIVRPSIQDYKEDRDGVLEKAIDFLSKKK